jgi:hypothetical protein
LDFNREVAMQVTGNGRVRRTESEWRGLVSRWKASGQSQRAFCREQNLQAASFQRWRQRLESPSSEPEFVAMTPTAAPMAPSSSWSLELILPNGCTLRFQG